MDVNKYRALFIEESREHLETTGRLLVELEAAGDAEAQQRLTDEIFRHVHSIKGMAASMGYEPITAVAHRLEDVVAEHRQRAIAPETVDLLLRGVDALMDQVECIAGERSLSQHLDLLQALRTVPVAPPPAPAAAPPAPAPAPIPAAARRVTVRLDESASSLQVRAFLVHRRLSEMTEILASRPTLEQIKAGQLSGYELELTVPADVDETACRRRLLGVPEVEAVHIGPAADEPYVWEEDPPETAPPRRSRGGDRGGHHHGARAHRGPRRADRDGR